MILQNGKRIDGCSDTVPVGTLQPYLGLVPPKGYLTCQGQLVSKITYSKLYEICGDTFGTSTETHFYLPDLRGKTLAGYDVNDTAMNTIGKLLGQKTHIHTTGNHTLTEEELPSHRHVGIYENYSETQMSNRGDGGGSGWNTINISAITSTQTNSYSYLYTGNAGGGAAHNHGDTGSNTNYQPTITVNWIVKAVMLIPDYIIVEDTLNSNSAVDALSARQGKMLNEKFTDYPTRAELLQYTNDYIIESGDKYRKWASGVAEAWGACYEYADPMVGTSAGNIYRCSTPLQINLPAGVFIDAPNISTDLRYCTVVSWVGTLGYENNATQIRSKYIMSPVNLNDRTVEYYVDWYAIGKWK